MTATVRSQHSGKDRKENTRQGNGDHKDSDSEGDSDYGWDVSLEADVHELLTSAVQYDSQAIFGAVGAAIVEGVQGGSGGRAEDVQTSVVYPNLTRESPKLYPDETVTSAVLPSVVSAVDLSASGGPGSPVISAAPILAATSTSSAPSPLARFRTAPHKPWSVSDLTSGAWCELQYEYTLTRLPGGRRTRTKAMQAGTRVHARLEEDVHTTVQVEVATREDIFGLKLWNIVQGLRTLRETGLTREFEVWGLVDGQVVNGIIDALSWLPGGGNRAEGEEEGGKAGKKRKADKKTKTRKADRKASEKESPSKSSRITDFFEGGADNDSNKSKNMDATSHRIFITDVKTRASATLPSDVAMRPSKIQLFLYHRFLAAMATGELDFLRVFERYGLDADAPFSDAFLAEVASLHGEIFDDDELLGLLEETEPRKALDDGGMLYGTLRSLTQLVQREFTATFPHGAKSLGELVTIEYRLRPQTRARPTKGEDGQNKESFSFPASSAPARCIGTAVLPVDNAVLDRYLEHYLQWWHGQRAATGVAIEEAALKCRSCEFAADCEWRVSQEEEHLRRARAKISAAAAALAATETAQ